MLFVGNQRGGAKRLAAHLMSAENDHVTVHSVSGFMADNLPGALNEAYALSRGTQCKQFLYSLSINPPEKENVATDDFVSAIDRAGQRLGLEGFPRAIVFHEKEGRRHAHAVWSRIDVTAMKAVNISYPKKKLMQLSRELYREHGFKMPEGFADSTKKNPKNYTRAEYEQAKRAGKNLHAVRKALQDAWTISDNRAGFAHALEERGYVLAKGDRKSFVAVDHFGEVYSIPRQAKIKTKQVRERLGDPADLPSVAETKDRIAKGMIKALDRFKLELKGENKQYNTAFVQRKTDLINRQRAERKILSQKQDTNRLQEIATRQARFRKGLSGLWDRLRGETSRIKTQNEKEMKAAEKRDTSEMDNLIFKQGEQRRHLVLFRLKERETARTQIRELEQDRKAYQQMRIPDSKPPSIIKKPRGPTYEL